MAFDRDRMKTAASRLAAQGVFIGTSSWKYPDWRGMLYDESRYVMRGKFSETRFNRDCLAEYAEVFKTVCVDATYYKFPDERYTGGMVSQVPEDFLFGFKITDEITIKKFANLPRFGLRAGKPNENFLNAYLFTNAFLKPCEPFKRNVGILLFEFSKFYLRDYQHGRDFVADLDKFLGFLGYAFIYVPLKFRYLISRIESAKTAAEERDAFALAARAGRVWELNRLRPQELPERARHITGDCVLELEWLESSAWTGRPYRAYRHVIDTNNMESLYVRYDK